MGLFSKRKADTAGADGADGYRAKKSGRGLGMSMTVYFDHENPNIDLRDGQRGSLSHLDYSPLPRITGQSFFMGVLVSMGGFV